MIWFASWWSISETNNQKVSMLGRDAHIISTLILTLFATSYVIFYLLICHTFLKRECIVKP